MIGGLAICATERVRSTLLYRWLQIKRGYRGSSEFYRRAKKLFYEKTVNQRLLMLNKNGVVLPEKYSIYIKYTFQIAIIL